MFSFAIIIFIIINNNFNSDFVNLYLLILVQDYILFNFKFFSLIIQCNIFPYIRTKNLRKKKKEERYISLILKTPCLQLKRIVND